MNPLESRKRLLVAESELNRAQLAQEWDAMTADVRTLASRVKSFSSIASASALLAAGLAAFRRGKPVETDVKPTWLQTIFKVTGMVTTFWLAFRAKGRAQEDREPNSRA